MFRLSQFSCLAWILFMSTDVFGQIPVPVIYDQSGVSRLQLNQPFDAKASAGNVLPVQRYAAGTPEQTSVSVTSPDAAILAAQNTPQPAIGNVQPVVRAEGHESAGAVKLASSCTEGCRGTGCGDEGCGCGTTGKAGCADEGCAGQECCLTSGGKGGCPGSLCPLKGSGGKSCCKPLCGGNCLCKHQNRIFGQFLFLSAANVDFRHAIPVDGTSATRVPIGRGGLLQPEHEPGFKVGGAISIDDSTSLIASFTNFESETQDRLSLPGGIGFVQSLTTHPNTSQVDTDSLTAFGRYDIDFRHIDLDGQALIAGDCCYSLNGRIGARYSELDQDFFGEYLINGRTTVETEIDFEGVGPRLGLDLDKKVGTRGLLVYGRGTASFLMGDFESSFLQQNAFDGVQAVDSYEDYRIVPILDLELGVGWMSKSGRVRVGAGYVISAWFNTMTTPTFIESVHEADFDDVSETLIFDGLAVHGEFRF